MSKTMKIVLGGGGVLVLLLILVGATNSDSFEEGREAANQPDNQVAVEVKDESDETVAVESPEIEEEQIERSPAFMLAGLDHGSQSPPAALVGQFEDQLDRLEQKCQVESQARMADFMVTGQQKLREGGIDMSLMEIGQAIEDSIPAEVDGVLQCVEVAAAFVTLRLGG